jgi:hypothetical protein
MKSTQKQRFANFIIFILKNFEKLKKLKRQDQIKLIRAIRIQFVEENSKKYGIKQTSVNAGLCRCLNIPHGKYLSLDKKILLKLNNLVGYGQ